MARTLHESGVFSILALPASVVQEVREGDALSRLWFEDSFGRHPDFHRVKTRIFSAKMHKPPISA
jgi:hypothetical protein